MTISNTTAPATGSTTTSGTGLVPLGASGIDVFPLNLGGNVFGWTLDEDGSRTVLDAYVEAGGNFIDTANVYSAWVPGNSGGESESILGRWLTDTGRHGSVHIATKVGALNEEGLSAGAVRSALSASLERLQTDSVALYYAHFDEEGRPIEEIVDTLAGVVADGLASSYGLSNWSAPRLQAAITHAGAHGLPLPAALQNRDNAVTRDDPALAELTAEHGILRLPYSALASGFLSGKYSRDGGLPDSPRAKSVQQHSMDDHGWAVLDAVTAVAAAREVPVAAIALAWVRATGAVPIASARTREQLEPLLTGVGLELSADEIETIDTAGR
jgi:aryl-alcohol dehydrogenase-like predicted oxidoreductase